MLIDALKTGQFGSIELNQQENLRKQIAERWESTRLLDGIQNPQTKATIATLFETTCHNLLHESTSADNSGSFETVVFPIVRRTFSRLLANDIVSVQAMNLPVGRIYYFRPVTSERKANFKWDPEDGYYIPKDGDSFSHYGLMGYERKNMNQDGAQDNRYYLPDEVINAVGTTGPVNQYVFNGQNVVFSNNALLAIPALVEVLKVNDNDPRLGTITAIAENNGILTITGSNNTETIQSFGVGVVEPQVTQYMKKSLYDLFYDDFLYDNSMGKVTINVGSAYPTRVLADGSEVAINGDYPLNSNDGSLRTLMVAVKGFNSYNAGRLTGPDGNEMDAENFIASMRVVYKGNGITDSTATGSTPAGYATFQRGENIPFRLVTQKYAQALVHYEDKCTADGRLLIELDFRKPAVMGNTIDGYIGIDPIYADSTASEFLNMGDFVVAWAQYDSLELETEMGEVSFQIEHVTVSARERKLRATWSTELAQDAAAFQNIDTEAELTNLMSNQMGGEIDREILRDLRKASPWQSRWDYNGWKRQNVTSTVYTQKDWNQTLITEINRISAMIQKSTLVGGADWIVVSAEISALFNDLEYFHVTDASAESKNYSMGIEKIGSIQGRYQVIVDAYAPYWSLIMGHKGTSMLDTGYIYAPYIPMLLTPTIINPMNFAPVKGIATRYAKKIINNRYYGAIRIDGLPHFDIKELR